MLVHDNANDRVCFDASASYVYAGMEWQPEDLEEANFNQRTDRKAERTFVHEFISARSEYDAGTVYARLHYSYTRVLYFVKKVCLRSRLSAPRHRRF